MVVGDARLVLAAVAGIALAIVLIVRGWLHPFVALLCGAFVIGPLGGETIISVVGLAFVFFSSPACPPQSAPVGCVSSFHGHWSLCRWRKCRSR